MIAADNLFEFSLADYIAFWRGKGGGSAIAVHELSDPSLAPLYGIVELAPDGRVLGMQEKPEHPRTNLASTATYLFSEGHLALIDRYFEEGNPPDPPGRFVTWRLIDPESETFEGLEPYLQLRAGKADPALGRFTP